VRSDLPSFRHYQKGILLVSSQIDLPSLRSRLARYDQEHVLQFWDELSAPDRQQLASQIEGIDLEQLATLIEGRDAIQDFAALAARADSPPAIRADGTGAGWTIDEAERRGTAAIRAGGVGALIAAGGQGTRLGFEQPKGMFPIGPVSGRTLFQIFADRLLAINKFYGVRIPLYVMTSAATDAETQAYFQEHDFLGLPEEDVKIFQQGTMPAVDAASGKLLLATKNSLALSPDGHGGTVAALASNGCFADLQQRGIEHLSYIQVDNPLAHLCDPVLIGHHLISGSEMTSEVIRKRYPTEKVGNVVSVDGAVQIIEYSDLPESAAELRTAEGQLKLWAGSIAVHVFDLDFLCRMRDSSVALPFHRALKSVPYIDSEGHEVRPDQANATKFEKFIFDLLPHAANAFVVESLPSQAFAPVKNANGAATDTPALAQAAISDQHRQWLEQAGATVASGVQVEINPRFAWSPEELKRKIPPNLRIEENHYFADQLE
jgi:UDP-N-acetylglucosamine/UDP-N-acetylgalactosamine diphosphorylase